jgi:hypothetical protein
VVYVRLADDNHCEQLISVGIKRARSVLNKLPDFGDIGTHDYL